jgi:penicillin-binding protein 2
MAPRRNPDIVVAVLLENGDWGWHSAQLAAQVISTFVNKQRKQENNVRIAETPPAVPSDQSSLKVPAKASSGVADEAAVRSEE